MQDYFCYVQIERGATQLSTKVGMVEIGKGPFI